MSEDEARREVGRAVGAAGGTAALARRSKLDAGTISDFISGKRWPQARTLNKLEKALGWETGRIQDLADDVTPPGLVVERTTEGSTTVQILSGLEEIAEADRLKVLGYVEALRSKGGAQ